MHVSRTNAHVPAHAGGLRKCVWTRSFASFFALLVSCALFFSLYPFISLTYPLCGRDAFVTQPTNLLSRQVYGARFTFRVSAITSAVAFVFLLLSHLTQRARQRRQVAAANKRGIMYSKLMQDLEDSSDDSASGGDVDRVHELALEVSSSSMSSASSSVSLAAVKH